MKVRNTFIIFLVSGFWHGANWTFVIWGFLNALYFLPLLLAKRNRTYLNVVAQDALFPTIKELSNMALTFGLTVLAWVFFRAENVTHAFSYLKGIFNSSMFSLPTIRPKNILILILFFLLIEWMGRRQQFAIETLFIKQSRGVKWLFYMLIIALVFIFSASTQQEFIYFQF
jgi:D-alanyl-lipoteichoic acid acyltransferase DltB (MBOAT superfamily)